MNSSNHQKKCKQCGRPLQGGRRPRSYCSNTCKQAAYYYRNKSCRNEPNNIVTAGYPEPDQSSVYADSFTPWREPQTIMNQTLNAPVMENNENAVTDIITGQPIVVMGVTLDRAFLTGVLNRLPDYQQRELSQLMLEIVSENYPDLVGRSEEEENGYSDIYGSFKAITDKQGHTEEQSNSERSDVRDGQQQRPVYPQKEKGSEPAEEYITNSQHTARYPQQGTAAAQAIYGNDTGKIDTGHQWPPQTKLNRSKAGYLSRFASPRINRGMNVWEEIAISVPAFMEAYVLHYAADRQIQAESEGACADGLVTVHVLFHCLQHRRDICKLLDLVLEAEEGLLDEKEFTTAPPPASGKNKQPADTWDKDNIWGDDEEEEDEDEDDYNEEEVQGYSNTGNVSPAYSNNYPQPQISISAALQLLGIT